MKKNTFHLLTAVIFILSSCFLPNVFAAQWSLDNIIKNNSIFVVKDQSSDHINLTLNNMSSSHVVKGKSGSALKFNGKNQYASNANATVLQTESITISAWVKPSYRSSFPDTGEWVASQGDNFGLYLTKNKRVAFYVKNKGKGWSDVFSPENQYPFNQWMHIAGTYNSRSKVLKIYVNGKKVGSSPWGSGIGYSKGNDFSIGSMQGQQHFQGNIDEVYVFNSAYSVNQIKKLAKEGGRSSTYSMFVNTANHTQNNSIKNDIINAKKLQTQSVSLSAWIYPKKRSSYPDTGEWVASQADNFGLYLTADRRVAFYVKNSGLGWSDVFSPVNSYRFNQWQHITGSFNATTNVLKLYINGVKIGSSPWGSGIGYTTGNSFTIGSLGGSRQFSGQVNHVKVFDSALILARVQKLFKETYVAVVPPTNPANPMTSPISSSNPVSSSVITPPSSVDNLVISINHLNKKLLRRSAKGTIVGKISIQLKKATSINSRLLNIKGTHSVSPEFVINTSNEIIIKDGVILSKDHYLLEAIYSSNRGKSNKLPITITIVNDFKGQTINVIALGDSITEGASYSQKNLNGSNVSANAVVPMDENNERPYGQSYRSSIAQLQGASQYGMKVNFIGTKSDDWEGDVEYDGWSGFTSADILFGEDSVKPLERLKVQGLIPQADVVFITLGTNDAIGAGQGEQIDTLNNLTQIIIKMRETNPNLVFLLAKIITLDSSNTTIFDFGLADGYSDVSSFKSALVATNERIPSKNQMIETISESLSTYQSPVISVDMTSVFAGQQARLLSDGIHPNNVGERKMAEKWIEVLEPFFDGADN